MGHFHAIAGSAPVIEGERVPWAQSKAIAKMMEEITGYADRGGSDRVRTNEEYGHNADVWLQQTICKYLQIYLDKGA